MERPSWPWRSKKTLKLREVDKQKKADTLNLQPLENVSPVPSFRSYEVPSRINGTFAPSQEAEGQRCEDVPATSTAEERAKSLPEKLTTALGEVAVKEEMIKQHQKAVNEVSLELERAQKENLSLKQELSSCMQHKGTIEAETADLECALKECMRQVRQVREEEEAKAEAVLKQNTQEWQKVKARLDAKLTDLERRLMESEAQNSAMTKSLQQRARAIVDANDAKATAEMQAKVAQVKIESLEKEISVLNYELHVLKKELQIRNEEKEYSKKCSESAHKQHLDSVKKVAKLEADCQRLRNLVKKKLPGPAALAQMKKEVDGMNSNSKARQRSFSNVSTGASSQYTGGREIELLRERMMSMEEETKLLKEALAKKNCDLQAFQILCTKSSNKPSLEDQMVSLQATPRESIQSECNEASVVSISDHDMVDVEDLSCSESWASALIAELAQFNKKEKFKPASTSPSDGAENADEGSPDTSISKPEASEEEVEQFQVLDAFCKDVYSTLSSVEQHLRALSLDQLSRVALSEQLVDVQNKVFQLGKVIKGTLIDSKLAVAGLENLAQIHESPCQTHNNPWTQCPSSEKLRFVLCKLIFAIEMLRPPQSTNLLAGNYLLDYRSLMQNLVSMKESVLEGRANILEFLVHMGVILSSLSNCDTHELERLLSDMATHAEIEDEYSQGEDECNHSQKNSQLNEAMQVDQAKLDEVMKAKAELEERLHGVEGELEVAKSDLRQSRQLVDELQAQLSELTESMMEKVSFAEKNAAELQAKLMKAEIDVGKLQASVASLTVDLADERAQHEGVVAKCEELEKKLQEVEVASHGQCADKEERLRKDREMAAAKEKLVECQRTILSLGRQLTALTQPLPSVKSCNTAFDSSILPNHLGLLDHYHQIAERTMAQEDEATGVPLQSECNTAVSCGLVSGNGNSDYSHFHVDCTHSGDHHSSHRQQLDKAMLLSAVSSPSGSPARYIQQLGNHSSSNYSRKSNHDFNYYHCVHHPGVRTSLTKSMNLAALNTEAHHTQDRKSTVKPPSPSKHTGFGRLFSWTKHHN